MSKFCIHCGSPFGDAENFCVHCGSPRAVNLAFSKQNAPLRSIAPSAAVSLNSAEMRFFTNESASQRSISNRGDVCLVFTNVSKLRHLLGAEYSALEARIARLVNSPRTGLSYLLLDCANTYLGAPRDGDWVSHVTLLQAAVRTLVQRSDAAVLSVFIVGDDEVIPMPRLENLVGPDDDVETDYPFASLSIKSPWEEMEPARVHVGRLPVGRPDGIDTALNYLDRLSAAVGVPTPRAVFGMSAQKWAGASRAVFGLFCDSNILISPPVSEDNLDPSLREEPDLLYFNLHGSNERDEPGWFGESLQGQYPVAIRPEHFARMRRTNIVGVEACYGAKFAGLAPAESTLLRALGSQTLGFVGASRIAFGPPEPPIKLADVVVGHFLKNVSSGKSLGSSLHNARDDLWESLEEDAHARLTVLEFNLFGDPNFVPYPGGQAAPRLKTGDQEKSPAVRLIQSVRAQADLSRRKTSKIIRKLRAEEVISTEIQRGLEFCRQTLKSTNIPLPQGIPRPEPTVVITEAGGKRNLILNYKVQRGPVQVGCSVVQDFDSTQITRVYIYR